MRRRALSLDRTRWVRKNSSRLRRKGSWEQNQRVRSWKLIGKASRERARDKPVELDRYDLVTISSRARPPMLSQRKAIAGRSKGPSHVFRDHIAISKRGWASLRKVIR